MGFRSVSCPSTHFCLASLTDNRLATWRDGTWSVTPAGTTATSPAGPRPRAGSWWWAPRGPRGRLARWSNGTISGAVDVGAGSEGNLSCPTSTCFLGRVNGSPAVSRVYRISGTTVTSHGWSAPTGSTLPCRAPVRPGAWSPRATSSRRCRGRPGPGCATSSRRTGWTCASPCCLCPPTSCVAVGISNPGVGAARWNGSTWSVRSIGAGWNTDRHVDCATTSACMVVDARGRFNRWTGSSWTSRTSFDTTRGGVEDLDCTTASSSSPPTSGATSSAGPAAARGREATCRRTLPGSTVPARCA